MRNKQILLSGRAVTTNAANVPADRYSFLHLSDAEPNLGVASANGWVLVYDTETPGNRLWSKNLITAYDHANSAYESQNTTGSYSNAAFLKANSAYESQNVTGTYANNAYLHANSAYGSQNTTGSYANSAFLKANSAYESQNTTGIYANAAFLKANSAYASQNVTGTYANNAYVRANNSLNANVGGIVTGNVTIVGDLVSNTLTTTGSGGNITGANSIFANYIFANNIDLQLLTNTAYAQANAGLLKANSAYDQANSAASYANSAFLKANSAYASQNVTGTYANNAYLHANSAYDSQNTTGSYANAAFLQANSAYESQNVTGTYANNAYAHANAAYNSQNTTGVYANSAYVRANNSLDANVGGTVTGTVNIAGDLAVSGNIYISGNVTSLDAESLVITDPILLLANNNTTDAVDMGFVAHYNTGPTRHTGLIRHYIDQTWYLFDNYIPHVQDTNLLDLSNTSFRVATLNANLTANLVSVRGIEIGYYSNAAFLQANTAYASQNVTGTYANNAYLHANSAYESQNVTGTYANNAYLHANSAYESQNTTGVYANAAFLQANSAYESQNVTGTYANNAYLHANSAYDSQNVTGTYANNAYLHANSAYESQNVTGTYANNAYLHANSSYESQNTTGNYANSAFLKANSAYESQNVTGTYANNAYIHANSAYESQNSTGIYANAAFLKTNSAYQHANSSYDSQNVTGTYANSAYTHANAAFLKANSAYESQNVTGTYANNAYLHANSAYESQNATGVYANAAFIKANAAVFSITTNVNELYSNTSSGNVQLGLANVNTNIGTWGGNEAIPVINVDGHGRILSVSNTTISVPPGTYIFPNTGQITTNANFGNVLIGLANVNSNIGTFGSEFAVPTITTDGYGRIISISNTTISIPQGTYIVNSNLITSNSSTGNVVLGLAESGVTPGTYGGQGVTPVVTVDAYGRVTVAGNVASAINALSTIVRASYTATAAQTIFSTTSSFSDGYLDVYINGIKLSPLDYAANPSLGQVTILNPVLQAGDVVDLQTATTYVINSNTQYSKVTYTANAGQTVFATSYTPGAVNVYLNGLRLQNSVDYTAADGTTIVISESLDANDVVEIERLSSGVILLENQHLVTRNTITVTANGDSVFVVGGGYRPGFVDVFLNGVKLNIPGDVTAINGNTITFMSPTLEIGDIIEVTGIGPDYSPANAISVSGGTVYGSLHVWNNVSVNNAVTTNTLAVTSRVNAGSLNVAIANISSNLQVSYNVTANAVNVATVYFNDGTFMSTAASGRGDGITWKIASANTTANAGEGILVDTTSANVHITLNASPLLGNTVRIVDMTGNFGINNCIIERNGQKIMGLNENLIISSNNAGIGLVYSNATHGWRLIENP